MQDLHSLSEGDATEVARNLARIRQLADDLAQSGAGGAFEVYKLARDTLEILTFDRISRDTLAKLSSGADMFQGYKVSPTVLLYMRGGQKINAIKEFRMETGLGLKEAKDWVENYMSVHELTSVPF